MAESKPSQGKVQSECEKMLLQLQKENAKLQEQIVSLKVKNISLANRAAAAEKAAAKNKKSISLKRSANYQECKNPIKPPHPNNV